MADGRFVSYLRVSTQRQGRSGLGLEAQRKAVADYLNGGRWRLVSELIEVESGANANRPKLAEALALCRSHRATLVVAKLDRLARDAHFLLGLQKAGVDFVAADMPSANRMTVGIMALVAEEERRMISARTKAALAAAKVRGVKLGGRRLRHADRSAAEAVAVAAAVAAAGSVQEMAGALEGAFDAHNTAVATRVEMAARARGGRSRRADQRAASIADTIARLDPTGTDSLRALAAKLTEDEVPTATGKGVWTAAAVARVRRRLTA